MSDETKRVPFEVYHPSVFIREEMEARGWDRDRLTTEMVGLDDMHEWGITRLSLDMYFDVGPCEPSMHIGAESAAKFARAFGVSPGLFLGLEETWRGAVTKATP